MKNFESTTHNNAALKSLKIAELLASSSGGTVPPLPPSPPSDDLTPPEKPEPSREFARSIRPSLIDALGLQVYKVPPVARDSEDGRATRRRRNRIMKEYLRLADPAFDPVVTAVKLSEDFYDHDKRKPKFKLPHCDDDMDDPVTFFKDRIEEFDQATHTKVCGKNVVSFLHLELILNKISIFLSDEYIVSRHEIRVELLEALEYFLLRLVYPGKSHNR